MKKLAKVEFSRLALSMFDLAVGYVSEVRGGTGSLFLQSDRTKDQNCLEDLEIELKKRALLDFNFRGNTVMKRSIL